jgi:segregation and condensation protein B
MNQEGRFAHARGPGLRRDVRRRPGNVAQPLLYRLLQEDQAEKAEDPLARDEKLARLEAALFLTDEPLTTRKLSTVAEIADSREVKKLLARLKDRYEGDGSPFQIEEVAGGYQLLTLARYQPWLSRMRRNTTLARLSPPALETLTIIAYRQPIVRAEIENIRGVQVGEMLTQLMEKGLIKIVGRQESLGRPVLYGTTKQFLQRFGLNSLKDLPKVE